MCELLLLEVKNKVDKAGYGHTNNQRHRTEKPWEYRTFKGHKTHFQSLKNYTYEFKHKMYYQTVLAKLIKNNY